MFDGKLGRVIAFGIIFLFASLLTACDESLPNASPAASRSAFPVDSVFKEFYQSLGGPSILGPAISRVEILEGKNIRCQFLERALMCFDPSMTNDKRYTLAPLGAMLGIKPEAPQGGITIPPGARSVDGYAIYEKFLPLYDRLHGAMYAGRPLTELRINSDLNRAEQFFENVGFYQDLNTPNGPVFLVPYGAYKCGGDCSYGLNEYWSIIKSSLAEQPFSLSVARLGGTATFGPLLLHPQYTPDGFLQQVYTNVILYAPANNPSDVKLRPLARMLNYPETPLVGKKSHENLVFYEISGGLGHNVPKPFDTFIANSGGRDLSGNPLTEVSQIPGQNLYRQCFENYCLIYDPTASEMLRVRMAPLGKEYLEHNPPSEQDKIQDLFTEKFLTLLISADKPNINDNEPQIIRMLVMRNQNLEPIELVEGEVILKTPNRPSQRYFFPATDDKGLSMVSIPPQDGLPNGTRVSYQVCLNLPSEKPICKADSYLIWNVK